MHNESDACTQCGGTTEVIKIVDATQPGMLIGATDETSAASHHIQLQYTAEDATRSAWSKQFPTAGIFAAKCVPIAVELSCTQYQKPRIPGPRSSANR